MPPASLASECYVQQVGIDYYHLNYTIFSVLYNSLITHTYKLFIMYKKVRSIEISYKSNKKATRKERLTHLHFV